MSAWKSVFGSIVNNDIRAFGKWRMRNRVEFFMYLPNKQEQMDNFKILGANPVYFDELDKLIVPANFKHGSMEVKNELERILGCLGRHEGVSVVMESNELTICLREQQ
ncbi:hypothetical protein ONV78_08150 [Hahella sp. CR1]|uniref:hypothetical protein n=1 Tax=Hahella sp. CR1 TaxID=2992807 RepID=UPI00244264E7|nr:hypothetical protein [Hahella sp. CR1]MDG9667698.1 hypothetical protein [Hahella sp. CR1]